MTQRFTIELERIDVARATVKVIARDLASASQKALRRASQSENFWDLNRGVPVIKKVTGHANTRDAP